jgi:hypothetical protein
MLAEDPRRNWDCGVNWWSTPTPGAGGDFEIRGGDNKLECFAQLYGSVEFLRRYRFILLADDDVYFRPGDISRFFDLCDRHDLYLAQPALRWTTNFSHCVTVRNPLCRIRRTSFVEVMAPCFSARALADLAHTFHLTRSTWGVDLAWASLLRGRGLTSVVDAVAVDHTRPLDVTGGAWYRKLEAMGVDYRAEYESVKRRFPEAGRPRTLPSGHVYVAGLPEAVGAPLAAAFDALIRFRFETLRGWRTRARARK